MPKLSIREVDLSNSNLQKAVLDGASMQGADLSQADLSGASLRHTNVRAAKLYGATLNNPNLNADLQSAYLTNNPPDVQQAANLNSAFLRNANLSFAQLSGANFTNASFYGFTGSIPNGCSVKNNGETNGCATAHLAVMNNTVFSGAYLFGADFTGAQATGADFGNAVLVDANFDTTTPRSDSGAALTTSFNSAFVQGANLAGAKSLDHVSLAGSFVDFSPQGNIMDIRLPGSHTEFPATGVSGVKRFALNHRVLQQRRPSSQSCVWAFRILVLQLSFATFASLFFRTLRRYCKTYRLRNARLG